ncbi:hypothetical protein [Flexithrix dorotheae]|uniref:hypothetical protein n=1 Tax=Flexithrix dorotheae TaxID=70993 RepID=UPI00037CE92E|nr:hypothetical protein [Flexithrix dorotheae]
MKVKESNQNHGLNSYYRAVQILKAQNALLVILVIVLVLTNIGSLYLSQATSWVSLPGQVIEVEKSFSNPYLDYNAEMHTEAFIKAMFTFEPATYESNLNKAQNWAEPHIYEQYYNFYYQDKQPETNVPLYYTWVENNVLVDVEMDSIKSHFNEENEIVVQFYGKQIFKKSFDYSRQTVTIFNAAAVVSPLSFRSDKNKMGLIIRNFVVESKPVEP